MGQLASGPTGKGYKRESLFPRTSVLFFFLSHHFLKIGPESSSAPRNIPPLSHTTYLSYLRIHPTDFPCFSLDLHPSDPSTALRSAAVPFRSALAISVSSYYLQVSITNIQHGRHIPSAIFLRSGATKDPPHHHAIKSTGISLSRLPHCHVSA